MFDFSAYANTYLAKLIDSDYRQAILKIMNFSRSISVNGIEVSLKVVSDGKLKKTNHPSIFSNSFITDNLRSFDMSVAVIEEKPKVYLNLSITHHLLSTNTDAVAFIKLTICNDTITDATIECDKRHTKELIAFLMAN
jgi:hypothetical protein